MKDAGELATALHILRLVRGWNQSELAAASGVRNSSISDCERGATTPELATLARLLEAMGYQLSTLDEARAFIRQVRSGELVADTDVRLLALEAGNVVARLAAALLETRK